VRRFLSGGERIGSDSSKLLEEHRSFLVGEPLQQALIEGRRRRRQRMGKHLSLSCQVKPNEAVINSVVDSFDEAVLFQSFDDACHHRSVKYQTLCQVPDREILFAGKQTEREPLLKFALSYFRQDPGPTSK
jgi:hypothetical protein